MPALYVDRQITLRAAQDSSFLRLHFQLKEHTEAYETLTYASDFRRDIAAGATVNLDLGGISAGKILFVESDAQLTIQINGTEDHDIEPVSSTAKAVHYHEGPFTSVSLINPDANNSISEVNWFIAGI